MALLPVLGHTTPEILYTGQMLAVVCGPLIPQPGRCDPDVHTCATSSELTG